MSFYTSPQIKSRCSFATTSFIDSYFITCYNPLNAFVIKSIERQSGLTGCVSFSKDMKEAIYNAKEVLMLHLYGMEKDSDPIPSPSLSLSEIRNDDLARDAFDNTDSSLVLIQVFMPPYRDSADKHFDKKTLSIPHWINKAAESIGINFSQTLQEALIQKLKAAGIERN